MELTCEICFDPYTTFGLHRPRCLPCGHSLCGTCAKRLLNNGLINCPACQHNYKYIDLEQIGINHELEKAIELLTSISTSTVSTEGMSNIKNVPSSVLTFKSPKLHRGICEEHGYYKLHHCLTHCIFICSECVIAYHLEADCCRVSISEFLNNKKTDLCKKINSQMSSLQDIGRELESYQSILNATSLQIRSQIDKLQQKLNICQKNVRNNAELIKECEDHQGKVQNAKCNIQSITTFLQLNKETQMLQILGHETQVWRKQAEDIQVEFFGQLFTSEIFANIVTNQETYAIYKQEGQSWWGRILVVDEKLIMKDLKSDEPPSGTLIFNSKDIEKYIFQCHMLPPTVLKSLLSYKEIYATYTHENQQRWGRILNKDGSLMLEVFRSIKPSTEALVLNLNDVRKQLSSPQHVYLSFSKEDGTFLGRVIIRLNEKAPGLAMQLTDLCIGHTGKRWVGSSYILVDKEGIATEFMGFCSYINENNEACDKELSYNLEENEEISSPTEGLVLPWYEESADFIILTCDNITEKYDYGPAIGDVVVGMPILKNMITDKLVNDDQDDSQVVISDSGLLITYDSGAINKKKRKLSFL